ncbi:MAG: undecaprenyl/decaprenyl-phosphate alpha-N-acetylglucosaminyl 1-phosphate transferase [Armatimonadetes bacterium]|nr:undecaprenyl/decaprenyl-phosphate alpha-N-acetylglucosaminyl 1-phosphate transferase [Armatimonadota bacterium]
MIDILGNRFMLAFIIAVVVALVVTPWVISLAKRFGVIDVPGDERRVHATPTPRWGGLAIFLGVAAAWLIVYPMSHRPHGEQFIGPYTINSLWIMGLGGAVVVFGMLDDKFQFPATWQALFLLVCGVLLSHPQLGDIRIEGIAVPFSEPGRWLQFSEVNSVLLTSVFVFVVAKTMDTIDGIDGLAGGVAAIIAITMFALALYAQPLIGVLSAGVIGACIGFLRYNYHPARIFMGTGGAQFLGFFLAAISIQGVVKTAAAVAFVVPLLVFGLPIIDAFSVVVRRILNRVPVTKADKRHIHHTLLGKGLSQRQAVWVLYLVTVVLCGTAVLVVKLVA